MTPEYLSTLLREFRDHVVVYYRELDSAPDNKDLWSRVNEAVQDDLATKYVWIKFSDEFPEMGRQIWLLRTPRSPINSIFRKPMIRSVYKIGVHFREQPILSVSGNTYPANDAAQVEKQGVLGWRYHL